MVNSELLSKMNCVSANFGYKLRDEMSGFQVQFYMVNSELLSKMYCINSNFVHKLRTEIGHFQSDIPTVIFHPGRTGNVVKLN